MSQICFQIYSQQTGNQVDQLMKDFFQALFSPANHLSHLTFSRILSKHADIYTDFVYFLFPADWQECLSTFPSWTEIWSGKKNFECLLIIRKFNNAELMLSVSSCSIITWWFWISEQQLLGRKCWGFLQQLHLAGTSFFLWVIFCLRAVWSAGLLLSSTCTAVSQRWINFLVCHAYHIIK